MYSLNDIKRTLKHIEASIDGAETFLADPYDQFPRIAQGTVIEVNIYRPDFMPVFVDLVATGEGLGADAPIFATAQACQFTRIMDAQRMTSMITTNLVETLPTDRPALYRVK